MASLTTDFRLPFRTFRARRNSVATSSSRLSVVRMHQIIVHNSSDVLISTSHREKGSRKQGGSRGCVIDKKLGTGAGQKRSPHQDTPGHSAQRGRRFRD